MSDTFTSSSYYYSSSSTTDGTSTTGHRYTTSSHTDPTGTTVRTARQELGEPAVIEERRYNPMGQEEALIGGLDDRQRITEMGEGDSAESGHVYGGPAVISTEAEENRRPVEAQRPEKGNRDIDRITYVFAKTLT